MLVSNPESKPINVNNKRPELVGFLILNENEKLSFERVKQRNPDEDNLYRVALVTKRDSDDRLVGAMVVSEEMAEEARVWYGGLDKEPPEDELSELATIGIQLAKILKQLDASSYHTS